MNDTTHTEPETDGFDAGPVWTAPDTDAAVEPERDTFAPPPSIDETQVSDFLRTVTGGMNAAVGGPDSALACNLTMTDDELAMIAPALTGYVNRVPVVAAVVERSDFIGLAVGVAMYGGRLVTERRENLAARQAATDAAAGYADVQAAPASEPAEPEQAPVIDGDSEPSPWGE